MRENLNRIKVMRVEVRHDQLTVMDYNSWQRLWIHQKKMHPIYYTVGSFELASCDSKYPQQAEKIIRQKISSSSEKDRFTIRV